MQNELIVVNVPIAELKTAEYNPRIWLAPARLQLAKSLDEFGFVQPIVANSNPERYGVVVGGNFKLDIARQKGLETVPVVWVNLTLEKEKVLNVRLNKNQGEFDLPLLAQMEEDMLKDIGFSEVELKDIFGEYQSDSKYTQSVSFSVTEDQSALIKGALALAEERPQYTQSGKRKRQVDALMVIIQEWEKLTGNKL